jgi:hypothetical protein
MSAVLLSFSMAMADLSSARSFERGLHEPMPIAESPEWSSPLSASGCTLCNAYASEEGFFFVAADCMPHDLTPHCLAKLISSLGSSRAASFLRHGVTSEPNQMLGVVVGRGANVTGAYAFDPGFWPGSREKLLNELPACLDESMHAATRLRFAEEACSTMGPSEVNRLLFHNPALNCRFSGLEAMMEQQQAFLDQAASACARASASPNQVSLRYGFEDVTAVVYTMPEHLRVATDFTLWLRKLSGRDIGLIRMRAALVASDLSRDDKPILVHAIASAVFDDTSGRLSGSRHVGDTTTYAAHASTSCECMAVAPAGCIGPSCIETTPPLRMPELGLVPSSSVPTSSSPIGSFCVAHRCDLKDVPGCCPQACRTPRVDYGSAQGPQWHGVFMHIPKTGGSSLECASQAWESAGLWTNMGHASFPWVAKCAERCSDRLVNANGSNSSITPAFIMAVRNPYSYWWSLYGYVRQSLEGKGGSGALASLQARNATASLATFDSFLHQMRSHGMQRTQTSQILRICGKPCLYHFLLRTETLDADWLATLGHLRLPLEPLPHVNVVAGATQSATSLFAVYTPELANIVQEMEPMLFDQFGYSRVLI